MIAYDACIVGGGVAGSSCALWLHHLGYKVCLIERTERLGGLQNLSPYPNQWLAGLLSIPGVDFAENIHQQLTELPLAIHFQDTVSQLHPTADGFSVTLYSQQQLKSRFIVIATGVRPETGGLQAGEQRLFGPGHHIARQDWQDLRVAILGGGDNAFENYLFIKQAGGTPHIYARSVRASRFLRVQVPGKDISVGDYTVSATESMINNQAFDGLVVMYGWQPNTPDWFITRGGLVNEKCFIITDSQRRTSIANIYAIGEATQHVHPCTATSLADGVIAAKSIQHHVEFA